MKLNQLQEGNTFTLSYSLDTELSRRGTILNITECSVTVRWDRHKVNDTEGNLVDVAPYTTQIAGDTEVISIHYGLNSDTNPS